MQINAATLIKVQLTLQWVMSKPKLINPRNYLLDGNILACTVFLSIESNFGTTISECRVKTDILGLHRFRC